MNIKLKNKEQEHQNIEGNALGYIAQIMKSLEEKISALGIAPPNRS